MILRILRRHGGSCARVRRTEGFSLIEIMIALTIVGILSVVSFVGIRSYVARAKRTQTESNLRSTQQYIETYHDDTGAYPATLQDLITKPTDPKLAFRYRGPYGSEDDFIKGVFIDAWKHDLQYHPGTSGPLGQGQRAYELYSWGPNGEGAQEGQISVWEI